MNVTKFVYSNIKDGLISESIFNLVPISRKLFVKSVPQFFTLGCKVEGGLKIPFEIETTFMYLHSLEYIG